MTKHLKVLGLALIAVFAMGAVVVASASAKYDSEIATTWIHGTSTTNHVFTTNAGTVTCKSATSLNQQNGTAVSGGFTAKTVKAAMTYKECTAFGFPAEVKMNGCEYEFLEPTSLKASSKIICPSGKQIEIVAFGFCTMTVGAQSPGGNVTFTNEGTGTGRFVKVTSAVTGIVYGGNCGSGTNGTYEGVTDAKGFRDQALTEPVGTWVTT